MGPDEPLGMRVIKGMAKLLSDPTDHILYFDNFFTSHALLVKLKDAGIRATGTIRNDRIKNCPIKENRLLTKEPRGSYDFCADQESGVIVVKWHDNSCVNVISNHESIEPLHPVKRWSRKDCKEITVQQPYLIHSYNRSMGGVDHLDWLVQKYRISIRSKKWYFPLFTNAVDVVICNAWILHCKTHTKPSLSLLDFRRNIAVSYIGLSSQSDPKVAGRPRIKLLQNQPRTNNGHFIQRTPTGRQRRCAVCKKNVRKQCIKCNVGLHLNCSPLWHTT